MKECIICDIDGTIANLTHRMHWIKSKPKNYKAFFAGVFQDTPHHDIITLVNNLASVYKVPVIHCSGRPDSTREDTEKWLFHNVVYTDGLYMRKTGDFRADDIVKEELLDQILADGYKPILVFDDRDRVVQMWRKRGFRCLQVAEGNF